MDIVNRTYPNRAWYILVFTTGSRVSQDSKILSRLASGLAQPHGRIRIAVIKTGLEF